MRTSHKKEKKKSKITAFKAQFGLKLAKHGWRFGETVSRHCKGSERERGEWVKKGREGKRSKRSAEKETCREREREQGGCDTRGVCLHYARYLHFLANPCLRYQDSKLFLRFFFFSLLFYFLLVPGFTCRTELCTLCDKKASKQEHFCITSRRSRWRQQHQLLLKLLELLIPLLAKFDVVHRRATYPTMTNMFRLLFWILSFFVQPPAGRPAGVVWSFFISPGASLDSRFIICYDRLILLCSRARGGLLHQDKFSEWLELFQLVQVNRLMMMMMMMMMIIDVRSSCDV